jgi:ABC-type polysaccharide/polyol phosphate transport system ATPase subunit
VRGDSVSGWRWALRDVDLRMEPGDAVGLIGSNGSGKSTLLKIIAGVMFPYAGSVTCVGRVGALIEVRAGIHPDLTGRENIHLYGSLLGLSRSQVQRRFDDIVEFSGLEAAIDRQVKFFSSGMGMRLGFAVAAFLEPDVLLVDEVLAVGDAAFQQRCLDRMRAVLAAGTTLVFVSHDLASVEAMCTRGIWLRDGLVEADGPIRQTMAAYRAAIESASHEVVHHDSAVRLLSIDVGSGEGGTLQTSRPCLIDLKVQSALPRTVKLFLGLSEGTAIPVFVVQRELDLSDEPREVRCVIASLPVPRGDYALWIGAIDVQSETDVLPWHGATHLFVDGPPLDEAPRGVVRPSPVYVKVDWD